ncbi:ABC transporter permease [Desulfovibrio mangrovi]|uniref:ABC transporter permease n=1 Tax=Desulfovibrio mangrovi TaxID=2976983 RepID=UPI0022458112|nr:FtsX-like permease family protein [Desulfovibrio mangrovi]UZP67089.1 ABC transporter permease [Desulfovibrio mangrovi]
MSLSLRDISLAARLALRELRSGKRRFTVFLSCLILGVFAIAAVGSVSESARSAINRDARILLGGDASVQLTTPHPTAPQRAWLEQHGTLSHSISLRGMAHTASGEAMLVAAKGVDGAYPLYGVPELSPAMPLEKALAEQAPAADGRPVFGAVVDALLLERLGLKTGEAFTVGNTTFRISAVLVKEPDRAFQGIIFGPRVLISLKAMESTGLLIPGSLIHSHLRVRLNKGRTATEQEVQTFTEALRAAFPDTGWRVEPFTRAAPRIRTFLDRIDADLLLIGLGALLVGGLGIAEAVRGYLASRIQNIATLKCVGGGVSTVLWTYFFQIAIIGIFGIAIGCTLGALVPLVARESLAEMLPVLPDASLHWTPLFRAALLGCLIIVAFSLRPLLLAGNVSPAVLFRGYVATQRTRLSATGRTMVAAAFASLAGLVFLFTPDWKLAGGFTVVVIGCLAVFRGVAWGMMALSRRAPQAGHPSFRLGIASIHRPGAPTVNLVFALGLGLTALVAIAQIEQNLTRAVERDLSREAPAFFFINILPHQLKDFETLAQAPGVTRMERGPMVRGRIIRIKDAPVEEVDIKPEAKWAVRGDRGLSHAAVMPEDTEIVQGAWWPENYTGPPIISLTDDLAKGFGVGIGDTLTFNILGREVTAAIANIRKVDWMTFQLQFAVLFAPGLLDNAPVTWAVTAYGKGSDMDALYRKVTGSYPNVTAFSMREILADVRNLMERMGMVFRAMAAVMLCTGLLVLAGAILADRHRRIYDAVIYKVCGATRGDILLALVTEFLLTGLATGLFSALTGTLAAWAAVEGLMRLSFTVQPVAALATIATATGFSLLFGLAGTMRALNRKPAPYLRNE